MLQNQKKDKKLFPFVFLFMSRGKNLKKNQTHTRTDPAFIKLIH